MVYTEHQRFINSLTAIHYFTYWQIFFHFIAWLCLYCFFLIPCIFQCHFLCFTLHIPFPTLSSIYIFLNFFFPIKSLFPGKFLLSVPSSVAGFLFVCYSSGLGNGFPRFPTFSFFSVFLRYTLREFLKEVCRR